MPGKTKNELIELLGHTISGYQASVDDFDREVARILGVNATDLRCLEALLRETPDASPGELADTLGLTTGAVTPMLDRLEKLGYIARSPHPSDRRRTIVRATRKAAARAEKLVGPLVAEGEGDLLTRYSASELALIVDFLGRADELQRRHLARLRETPRHGR